jgi:hypothetical protein
MTDDPQNTELSKYIDLFTDYATENIYELFPKEK